MNQFIKLIKKMILLIQMSWHNFKKIWKNLFALEKTILSWWFQFIKKNQFIFKKQLFDSTLFVFNFGKNLFALILLKEFIENKFIYKKMVFIYLHQKKE